MLSDVSAERLLAARTPSSAASLDSARGARVSHTQAQREVVMSAFRNGKFNVLVATDVAARGLDISGIGLVIQSEPPKDAET